MQMAGDKEHQRREEREGNHEPEPQRDPAPARYPAQGGGELPRRLELTHRRRQCYTGSGQRLPDLRQIVSRDRQPELPVAVGRVMTIQSRLTIRDGAWLSAMDESLRVNTNSRPASGAETTKPSVPTVSRFGPRKGIHIPRVPPNPPVPRTLARWRGTRKDTPASISLRNGAFRFLSRLRRAIRYTMPQAIARVTTNSMTALMGAILLCVRAAWL